VAKCLASIPQLKMSDVSTSLASDHQERDPDFFRDLVVLEALADDLLKVPASPISTNVYLQRMWIGVNA
jgi:hypothetical protein